MIRKINKGFTLVELLTAMVIVAILAAVAIPTYIDHIKHANMVEAKSYAISLKVKVADCIERQAALGAPDPLSACDGGVNGIPANITGPFAGSKIASATVVDGSITVYASNGEGIGLYPSNPNTTQGGLIIWSCGATPSLQGICPD